MRPTLAGTLTALLLAAPAWANTFKKGSLIIPMDTTYQDNGMLTAYGLLYKLLQSDIKVHWVIKLAKKQGEADFTCSSKDFATGAAVSSHGYRGGPFVIEDSYAAKAGPVVTAYQKTSTSTVVHIAEQDFTARSARLLSAAPTIAVIADGNEGIAFKYLNAAGIPDRNGKVWSATSPDVLTTTGIAGPTTTKHNDGSLFRSSGLPAFCQIMTMHWGVTKAVDEVVAEYREFLKFPTHMMAECQAVNAIENNTYGRFLTPHGFTIDNNIADTGPFEFLNLDTPFVQIDGTFKLVGGSEQAYTLPVGDKYHDQSVVMIKDKATALGVRSIWMTGYLDGKCTLVGDNEFGFKGCAAGVGKISYLGGHQYGVKLPISTNPTTQGTRLFLNSLFEASCTTGHGQPYIALSKKGPSWTTDGKATYTLSYGNSGPGPGIELVFTDTLATGVSYVSSTGGGTLSGSTVTWKVGDLAAKTSRSVQLTVSFASYGTYTNYFSATYKIGMNSRTVESNKVTTSYQATPPPDGGVSGDGDGGGGAGEGSDSGCDCRIDRAPGTGAAAVLALLGVAVGLGAARTRFRCRGRAREPR